MAYAEHFKLKDVKRVTKHNSREQSDKTLEKNRHIDPARKHINYPIDTRDYNDSGTEVPKNQKQLYSALESRLNDLQATYTTQKTGKTRKIRSDANVMSNWIVTAPREFIIGTETFVSDDLEIDSEGNPKFDKDGNEIMKIHKFNIYDREKTNRFFRIVYEFCQRRYGDENVLQGFVHGDETSEHIHISLMPVIDGRLSTKALFTRKELIGFHKDLEQIMNGEFGMTGFILNGRTKGKYTVAELKTRTQKENEIMDEYIRLSYDDVMLKNEQIINEVNEEELIQKEAEFEDYVVEKNKQIKSGEKDVEKSKSELETLRNEVTELQKSAADEMKNAQNILAIAEAEKRKNVTAQEEIETQKKELEKEAQQLDEREKSIEQIINSRVKKEKELIVNEANVIISQKCDEWVKQVLNNASELNFYARFGADKQYVKQAADNLKIPTVTEKDVGPELG